MVHTPLKSLENSTTSQRDDLRKSAHTRSVSTPFAHNPVSVYFDDPPFTSLTVHQFTTVPPNYRETQSPQAVLQAPLITNGKRSRGESPNISPDWPDPKRARALPRLNPESPTRRC
jgi:hypothetical protein